MRQNKEAGDDLPALPICRKNPYRFKTDSFLFWIDFFVIFTLTPTDSCRTLSVHVVTPTPKGEKIMASITELIALRQQQNEKTEAITARIPVSYVAHLDELSSSLDVTRQFLLTEMIKEKVDEALALYAEEQKKNISQVTDDDDEPVSGSRFFILNTNKRYEVAAHRDMVTNGVAAAFCDPWKFQIERIKEGDVVFLYENGVGIVGTGIAPRELEKAEHDGVVDDAYRKKLIDYKRVKPLSARDIKKVVGSNLVFLQVLFKVPTEFGKKIQENLQEV